METTYLNLINFTSLIQLFAVYYLAFTNLPKLQDFSNYTFFERPKKIQESVLESTQAQIEKSIAALANKVGDGKFNVTILINTYYRVKDSEIKEVDWIKVGNKYNPIFLFFGLYCLFLLMIAGLEANIVQSHESGAVVKLQILYSLLFIINTGVFVTVLFILLFQKVDKNNGKASKFYKNPKMWTISSIVVLCIFFVSCYKYSIFNHDSFIHYSLTKKCYPLFCSNPLFTNRSFIYILLSTIFFPLGYLYVYPLIMGNWAVIKIFWYSRVLLWGRVKIINFIMPKDSERDILNDLGIPK